MRFCYGDRVSPRFSHLKISVTILEVSYRFPNNLLIKLCAKENKLQRLMDDEANNRTPNNKSSENRENLKIGNFTFGWSETG